MLEVHILASGSDGNCTVIQYDDEAIMIDAGISCARARKLMDLEGVDEHCIKALMVTHEHADHIQGVGPISRKMDLPVYCNPATIGSFNPGNVDYHMTQTLQEFQVGNFNITPLPTLHDAADPCAYTVTAGDSRVLIATDTGKFTAPLRDALQKSDFAIVEANYDNKMLIEGPYPEPLKRRIAGTYGHMCNLDSAKEIKDTAVNPDRKIFLGHLSKHNNTPDIARDTVAECTGIKRFKIDCLEFFGDTRTVTVSR